MITNFNDFKQKMNESNGGGIHKSIDPNPMNEKIGMQVIETCRIALKCGLNRTDTIKVIETAFTNPAKAPEEINVKFVQENLDKIKSMLQVTEDKNFGPTIHFTKQVLESKNPSELALYVNVNSNVIDLYDSLLKNITKEGFKVVYENNIFYINNFDILNENNQKVVLKKLEKEGAINIATQLKWARVMA